MARALVGHVAKIDGARGCPLGWLVGELGETQEYREAIASGFATWKAYFANGFARMRAAGRLPLELDLDGLAMEMLVAVQGGLLLAQVERSSKPLEIALDMAVSHVRSHLSAIEFHRPAIVGPASDQAVPGTGR
ncbi:TetR family transcriptional regulator C-terminal domain-containing protein [Mesorhizobium sp. B2-3-5]|uniref:LmrA/YxaF family transcription factor n=1 Tax=Mesorhizobium sp. B2-3-5 TaxID=2589958 RepID=UPI0011286FF4|nr:TetR family transcriptional regulator C-terminal domain-containing protein [Mesorhizobium sp. B2-3-5]TPM26897.1 hypothetical protein FJ958_18755 [Mesorhizobium sp. B2-3-5]